MQGGNFGEITVDGGALMLKRNEKRMMELSISSVSQCAMPGHKRDELEIQFVEAEGAKPEEQMLLSMRIWVPGQQAQDIQSRILSKVAVTSSSSGKVLVAFDREQGNFLFPKNKFNLEL